MLKNLAARLAHWLLPRVCAACGEDVPAESPFSLCDKCWISFPRITGVRCEVCGLPLPEGGARCVHCRGAARAFRACRSAGIYEGALKTCLLRLKYEGRAALAPPLGRLLLEAYAALPGDKNHDAVTAVPMPFWRRRGRGYNPAALLAKAFGRAADVPFRPRALRRMRRTQSQTRLGREERFKNVSGAFGAGGEDVRGKTILVVDDVCTTGATLEACARALLEAGAARVDAVTVARQI